MAHIASSVLHYCNIAVKKCTAIPPRLIDYYDLTFVLDGEMIYHQNGERIKLSKNDVLFLKPGTLRAREVGKGAVRYVSFNFLIRDGEEPDLPAFIENGVTQEIKNAVTNYPTAHITTFPYSKDKCLMLLNYILFCILEGRSQQSNNEYVVKILQYVEQNITQPIGLRQISRQVGLSREYTSALFHQEMGVTLTDYVNKQKMILAREMILTGEYTLCDVAERLGFESYNYFSRLFKRIFGISPIQIRKQ